MLQTICVALLPYCQWNKDYFQHFNMSFIIIYVIWNHITSKGLQWKHKKYLKCEVHKRTGLKWWAEWCRRVFGQNEYDMYKVVRLHWRSLPRALMKMLVNIATGVIVTDGELLMTSMSFTLQSAKIQSKFCKVLVLTN